MTLDISLEQITDQLLKDPWTREHLVHLLTQQIEEDKEIPGDRVLDYEKNLDTVLQRAGILSCTGQGIVLGTVGALVSDGFTGDSAEGFGYLFSESMKLFPWVENNRESTQYSQIRTIKNRAILDNRENRDGYAYEDNSLRVLRGSPHPLIVEPFKEIGCGDDLYGSLTLAVYCLMHPDAYSRIPLRAIFVFDITETSDKNDIEKVGPEYLAKLKEPKDSRGFLDHDVQIQEFDMLKNVDIFND